MKSNVFARMYRGARTKRFAIVAARFNQECTDGLVKGALNVLHRAGILEKNITVLRVSGSFEVPLVAQRCARSRHFDAILCLGVVIKGETPHFQYVAGECARGIMEVMLNYNTPLLFGIVTALNLKQAKARSSRGPLNRGAEAANAALEMIDVLTTIRRANA